MVHAPSHLTYETYSTESAARKEPAVRGAGAEPVG